MNNNQLEALKIFKQVIVLSVFCFFLISCGDGSSNGTQQTINTQSSNQVSSDSSISLSGTIHVAKNTMSDSDTNDAKATPRSNNLFSEAQVITNPITLGGYSNRAYTGAEGNSYVAGDVSDLFRVKLQANQLITLDIADYQQGDLELYIFPADCDDERCSTRSCGKNGVVEGSIGRSILYAEQETIATGSVAGEFVIEVCSYSGASNYTLSIRSDQQSNIASQLDGKDKFVTGDVIVRFKQNAQVNQKTKQTSQGSDVLQNTLGLTAKSTAVDMSRPMLLSIGNNEHEKAAYLRKTAATESASKRDYIASLGEDELAEWDTRMAVVQLKKRSDVENVELNHLMKPLFEPNDAYYEYQWHYPLIDLPAAWDVTTGDSNVSVAVIDTGVLVNHPDLQGKLVDGYDFISDRDFSGDGDGIDNDPDDPVSRSASYHGTHVAGIVAARSNDGEEGVAGVAWQANIMPIRVLGDEGGTRYDVMQGIRYAAGLSNDSGTVPDKAADILNLSFGGERFSEEEAALFKEIYERGIIIIAAAGNSASSQPLYPASYDGVVSVSAVNYDKQLASYSSFGSTIDIAAPGGDRQDLNNDGYQDGVLSTIGRVENEEIRYSYGFLFGTSMATPHVAGVAALMKAVNPELTAQQFDALLVSGKLTEDSSDTNRNDQFGYGLINAYKAVTAEPEMSNGLLVTPSTLNFGRFKKRLMVTITDKNGKSVPDLVFTANDAFISVEKSNQASRYVIQVDRSGLKAGSYMATLSATSVMGDVTILASLQVSDNGFFSADAGHHYVLLLEDKKGALKVVDVQETDAVDGQYQYAFKQVPAANYYIIAGTDMDNDGSFNQGEAYGAYPNRENPQRITATKSLSQLNFLTHFETIKGQKRNNLNKTLTAKMSIFPD